MSESVLEVHGLTKVFRVPRRRAEPFVAVRDVSFTLGHGEVVALVGESGSGKTTIGRMLAGIETPTEGSIRLSEESAERSGRSLRQRVQMVFQDPYAALNPFNRISYTISRPIINYHQMNNAAALERAREILGTVQLIPADEYLEKRPHQLSGGQRQRVVIARALAASPEIVIADEPVSMLDVSIRADVLRLLRDLLDQKKVSAMLYITHDLLSARLLAQRIMVLYRGNVVEIGETETLLTNPLHPYTKLLWSAIPNPRRAAEGKAMVIPTAGTGDIPKHGCPFAPRCPLADERCQVEMPPLEERTNQHAVACHMVEGV
ncbi:MAG: ABC transporter ATP-binding protein [Alicyclobacillaceae bacterium]|nr:ABC transporter ATP-binding protein [Alicyclobacillaceae bacterium]MCY0894755.1 ABC transporter ATP-binding protein [Alicyclobacillaceae bacterium]